MRRLHGPRRTRGRGQALVEFALVFPVMMLLLIGFFDLARGVYAYNTVANAAREGARVAAVNQLAPATTNTQCAEDMPIEDTAAPHWWSRACAAAAAVSLGLTVASVDPPTYTTPAGTTLDCDTVHVGCIATVTVHYNWAPMTPILSSLVSQIPMSATSQIPVERVFP
jgi:Flp pilus assembly protein TadG